VVENGNFLIPTFGEPGNMETLILIVGAIVTILLITGIILTRYERSKELQEMEEKMKWKTEYRTNEEFVSYP
jgi:glucose uptake protein GlcU